MELSSSILKQLFNELSTLRYHCEELKRYYYLIQRCLVFVIFMYSKRPIKGLKAPDEIELNNRFKLLQSKLYNILREATYKMENKEIPKEFPFGWPIFSYFT